MTKSGCYIIINRFNDTAYIGKSERNVYSRLNQWKRELKKGIARNKRMQKDYSLYPQYFTFKVLLQCQIEDTSYWEQISLNEAKSQFSATYNVIQSPFKDIAKYVMKEGQFYENTGFNANEILSNQAKTVKKLISQSK